MSTPELESPTRAAVTSYLAGMRAALDDLPAAEVEEIMDDVGPHVAEVADELGDEDLDRRLAERLGSPEQYAAELRAAAGYPPRAAAPRPAGRDADTAWFALITLAAAIMLAFLAGLWGGPWGAPGLLHVLAGGLALVSLVVLLRRPSGVPELAELPVLVRARQAVAARTRGPVETYARLLQPSWWLARAGVAALMVVLVLDTNLDAQPLPLLALFAVFAVGSIWVGRRSQNDRRWLWAVLPLNAFAVGLALFLLADRVPFYYVAAWDQGPPPQFATVVPLAPEHENIFVYDRDGKPLTDVYLYDQDGQPITPHYQPESCTPRALNQYPKPEVQYREGRCVEAPARPPAVIPFTDQTPTSSPTPTTVSVTPTR